MIIEYRYPALVSGLTGASRKFRPLMVAMRGRAEIEELDFEDAPVAATVYMQSGKVNYRWYRNKLYRAAPETGLDEFRSGLDTHMAQKVSDACHLSVGKDIQPWPKESTSFLQKAVIMRDNFRAARGEYMKIGEHEWDAMLPLSSLGAYEQPDLDRWEDAAARYVGDLIFLDGDLWVPVAEPVLATVVGLKAPYVSFVDATVYDSRNDNPKDQPPPFGRRDGFTSPYWNPGHRFHSILDLDELAASELGKEIGLSDTPWFRSPEIYLPEALSRNRIENELDRTGRVVVAELHSACKEEFGSIREAPPLLREHWNAIRQLLPQGDLSDETGDQLVRKLQLIRFFLIGGKTESFFRTRWKSDTLISLIKSVADVWGNREIDIAMSWGQTRSPGL
ncbi:hypothetical protein GOB57_24990 [Sinorhizobium meliloti]|nr:hypothetical protein [Sinorhizobium meliloti]